nr:immunoglobulin light chain junction region [Macaca mulatta]MOY06321.1 immunoglobulin light chain junction region [Macaca mulatta]MOY06768.1 immunoglobulin light chain junction region [Macaca mulatta]MOY06912.1 immunoglobulin light chain junction region [Macaca mulatta]
DYYCLILHNNSWVF